jgi:hypothetical protein
MLKLSDLTNGDDDVELDQHSALRGSPSSLASVLGRCM